MPTRKTRVLPDLPTDKGVMPIESPPFSLAPGDTTWLCGGCDTPLLVDVPADLRITSAVKCPKCGAISDFE